MSNSFLKVAGIVGLVVLVILCLGMGMAVYANKIPRQDEAVKASWAEVQNQYQRRADLVPNLVATVKGYAAHEKDTLTAVVEARAKATQTTLPPQALNDPAAFQKFEAAQGQLTQALGRLMVISERYPDLKANQNFLALQAQLEGTENRITVARRDYISAVQVYNVNLRTIPMRWVAGMFYPDAKPYPVFTATAPNAQNAPKVQF